jgi:hypothetical protein
MLSALFSQNIYWLQPSIMKHCDRSDHMKVQVMEGLKKYPKIVVAILGRLQASIRSIQVYMSLYGV